jgi:hypothetical protein
MIHHVAASTVVALLPRLIVAAGALALLATATRRR